MVTKSLFHSQAEAQSRFPPVPTAPGRSDSMLRFAASPGLSGQTACNWLHTGQRSLHRSLWRIAKSNMLEQYHTDCCKKPDSRATSLCHSSYIYNRKTAGSDTWWLQTSPQRSLRRWVSGVLHTSPYTSAHQCRDLSKKQTLFSSLKHAEVKLFNRPLLTCQGGIEVFEL